MAVESLDEVRSDIAHHKKMLASSGLPEQVAAYFRSTLYPLIDTLVGNLDTVIADQGEALDELIEGEEELLHGDTAQDLIGALSLAATIIDSLKTRVPPGDPVLKQIEEYGLRSAKLMDRIVEITVPDDESEGEGDGDGEEAEEEDADGDDE